MSFKILSSFFIVLFFLKKTTAESHTLPIEILDNEDFSFNSLMKLDEKKENAEKIGCLIKTKFSEHVDFYNNSFHIEDGLLENLAINVTSDCFNDAEGDDFGCMHFYNIFSCVKKYVVKGMEECEKRVMVVYACYPESVSKKEDVKSAIKCAYEQMNFFNGTYFDQQLCPIISMNLYHLKKVNS
uniref:Uncharacterized protein n=1 Tax=Megaselia scalaris TaxID=36166 RepID=T1H4L4_MEGSC